MYIKPLGAYYLLLNVNRILGVNMEWNGIIFECPFFSFLLIYKKKFLFFGLRLGEKRLYGYHKNQNTSDKINSIINKFSKE